MEHLLGAGRESGRLLRRLLQSLEEEMVAWTRAWWRSGEKYIHDAELYVYLYCMYGGYVLYICSIDLTAS